MRRRRRRRMEICLMIGKSCSLAEIVYMYKHVMLLEKTIKSKDIDRAVA